MAGVQLAARVSAFKACFTMAFLVSPPPVASVAVVFHDASKLKLGLKRFSNTTQPTNTSKHFVALSEQQLEHEFEFTHQARAEVVTVSKLMLVVLTSFLGGCGIDRCFVGSYVTGALKGLTLGGLGIWSLIDFVIVAINAFQMSPSINELGIHANFTAESISPAYTAAIVCLTFHVIHVALVHCTSTGREKVRVARDHSAAQMPTLMSRALRVGGLLPDQPSLPEVKALFKNMDLDGNGVLDKSELKSGLESLGCTDEIVDAMIKQADIDGDGKVNLAEFIMAIQKVPT